MPQPEPSRHHAPIPSISRQAIVIPVIVAAIIHSFLVMLWVMPVNPFRDAVGQQHLANYIDPYFAQSWSVFAPVPRRQGESVVVRAYIGIPGSPSGKSTEWFDITSDEDKRIKFLVNPSRIHSATRRLGGNINTLMARYNAEQQRLVAADFARTSRSRLGELLNESNSAGEPGRLNTESYLRNDEMITRFGTLYATARWGKGVSMVEFKVGRRDVPAFADRKRTDLRELPFRYYLIGWRKAMPGNTDAQAAFDSYVAKASAVATPGRS
ncbi:MAG: DUF5819 family protein [Aeromicrobium sp.]